MLKSISLIGAGLGSVALIAGCATGSGASSATSSAGIPSMAATSASPEPQSANAVVTPRYYATLEELRDAYAQTGVDCSGWQQTDDYPSALASGSCSDKDLLALFADNASVLASLDTTAEALYELESDSEVALLVGDNWRISTDSLAIAEDLASKLGGEAMVITADSYVTEEGAPAVPSDYEGPVIEDGSWIVGTDFPAGTYTLAESPVDSCYWGIYEGGTNQDEIIANDNVLGGFPTVVLKEGDEFESSRCGVWISKPISRSLTDFGDGVWTVGRDIQPGKYRVTEAVSEGCYWAVLKARTNGDDILNNDIVDGGRPSVTLKKGQEFKTSGCGSWAPQ